MYRELWRVTERSDAMCIIADCRFPLAHTPVSLFNYLKKNRKAVIVLLNKEDLCPKENVDAWKQFYEKWTKQLGLRSLVISYSAIQLEQPENRLRMMEQLVQFARNTLKVYAPKQITIGFVGQPSVGKSRTVNGLAGKIVA